MTKALTKKSQKKTQEVQESAGAQTIDGGSGGQGGSQECRVNVRRVLEVENQREASGNSTDSEMEHIRRRLNNQKKK